MENNDLVNELLQQDFFKDLISLSAEKLVTPQGAVEPGETVAGRINNIEQYLYSIAHQKRRLSDLALIKLKYEILTEEEKEALANEISLLKKKSELYLNIMWIIIKDRLSLWGEFTVGVRDRGDIIFSDESTTNNNIRNSYLKFLISKDPE